MNAHTISLTAVTVSLALLTGGCTAPTQQATRPGDAPLSPEPTTPIDWLTTSTFSPTFSVRDTESSLGPYDALLKELTLNDLVRMHGHACDGLVTAAAAFRVGLDELYPQGVIDRTDTGCLTNNSPCFGDVAAYLTGGRIRFGTQKIDPSMGSRFLIHRFSTQETVEVALRPGLFPEALRELETKVRGGHCTQQELLACQAAQWAFARGLLQRPLTESFTIRRLPEFVWTPDVYSQRGRRGDIINRDWAR